jgi:hypothetical protein
MFKSTRKRLDAARADGFIMGSRFGTEMAFEEVQEVLEEMFHECHCAEDLKSDPDSPIRCQTQAITIMRIGQELGLTMQVVEDEDDDE